MALKKNKKLSDLKANPDNPRTVTEAKLSMLKKALEVYGDLGGFVYNRKTCQLVGGHQRAKVLPMNAKIVIEREYSKPTKTGTVAEGFVEINGERFSYREVSWSLSKEKGANIAANKGAGEWDFKILGDWIQELSLDKPFNLDLTLFDENERRGFLTSESFSNTTGKKVEFTAKEKDLSAGLETSNQCPKCHYEW